MRLISTLSTPLPCQSLVGLSSGLHRRFLPEVQIVKSRVVRNGPLSKSQQLPVERLNIWDRQLMTCGRIICIARQKDPLGDSYEWRGLKDTAGWIKLTLYFPPSTRSMIMHGTSIRVGTAASIALCI